jgi:translation initiation factor IF-2
MGHPDHHADDPPGPAARSKPRQTSRSPSATGSPRHRPPPRPHPRRPAPGHRPLPAPRPAPGRHRRPVQRPARDHQQAHPRHPPDIGPVGRRARRGHRARAGTAPGSRGAGRADPRQQRVHREHEGQAVDRRPPAGRLRQAPAGAAGRVLAAGHHAAGRVCYGAGHPSLGALRADGRWTCTPGRLPGCGCPRCRPSQWTPRWCCSRPCGRGCGGDDRGGSRQDLPVGSPAERVPAAGHLGPAGQAADPDRQGRSRKIFQDPGRGSAGRAARLQRPGRLQPRQGSRRLRVLLHQRTGTGNPGMD